MVLHTRVAMLPSGCECAGPRRAPEELCVWQQKLCACRLANWPSSCHGRCKIYRRAKPLKFRKQRRHKDRRLLRYDALLLGKNMAAFHGKMYCFRALGHHKISTCISVGTSSATQPGFLYCGGNLALEVNVKESRNRPGVAQRVPRRFRFPDFMTFGT